ncbi:lysosomal-trafficking regulator [Anastrepha ludens]|uniref:lysosomal-trafficking regulator n=1 Tax=Anastrepha ludens TaxID=28586 RepID=UPI0023B1C526|nr:lysosomal-trafficking regulator [Anastrepha ludens]XP_053952828.1 lysosomal-trafficking regulator [Anastrepha ludens]XP_053952829.1 lysosomal-trafficking regulator [Anastrepha ludens]XP_053952830.1 lysosomal-trafficking regulator [Anastrepha ludens]XP_053952831.1 lysosomal-trafficking regulator [Anastrepha ludens]
MEQKVMQAEGSAYLLADTLSIIWENYLGTDDDSETKLHWMELFLFYFQYAEEDTLQSEVMKSLMHNIPEEITSYLLETVCNIINKSPLSIPSYMTACDNTNLVQEAISYPEMSDVNYTNKCFTPLILNDPSDWSKIIALRSFLTNNLGKQLLRFLLRVDNKLIASQKGLCNLCIKLFPNCKWNTEEIDLHTPLSVLSLIGSISPLHMPNLKPQKREYELKLKSPTYKFEEELKNFRDEIASSDEIAYLLVKLISKCAANECEDNLNCQSVSMISLDFALECLCSNDEMYTRKQNATTIKLELLQLMIHCINNIINVSSGVSFIQFQDVFAKLAAILQKHVKEVVGSENVFDNNDCTSLRFTLGFLSAINYIIFYIIQSIIIHLNKSNKPHQGVGSKSSLCVLKFVDENVVDISIETFHQVLQNLGTHTDIDVEARMLIVLTFRALIKIIDQLFKNDQIARNNYIYPSSGQMRRRCRNFPQVHCCTQAPTISCFFQSILLNLLPKTSVDMQEYGVRYLLHTGVCCCHYTINTYATCLNIILNFTPKYQNCIYKFLHRRILCTIFLQDHIGHDKRQAEKCAKCDTKFKSLEFREEILQLYKVLLEKLMSSGEVNSNKITSLHLLLRHLKYISDILSSDMAAGILAELILPTFRRFKAEWLENEKPSKVLRFFSSNQNVSQPLSNNSHITACPDNKIEASNATVIPLSVLQDCLNVFVAYLGIDIRLIKAFYNEENISHLEELFCEPTLVHSLCDLIQIGIDNMTFLGENNQEQSVLSQRLIMLLLNSGEESASLFNYLLNYSITTTTSDHKKEKEVPEISRVVDILNVATLQWSFTYELLQTSQCFFNAFSTLYNLNKYNETPVESIDTQPQQLNEQDCNTTNRNSQNKTSGEKTLLDILTLNYNALCSFLQISQQSCSNTSKHIHPQYHIYTSTPPPMQNAIIDPEANKEDGYLSSSLESLLSSIEVESIQHTFDSISSSIASTATTIAAWLDNQRFPVNDRTFQTDSQCYAESFNLSFLNKLKHHTSRNLEYLYDAEPQTKDSIVIYDIRNQVNSRAADNLSLPVTTAALNTSSVGTLATPTVWNCAADALSTSTLVVGPETYAAVLKIGTSIIGKLFSVLSSFFGSSSNTNSVTNLNKSTNETCLGHEIDPNLISLLENSSDSRRYLLRLFETTMAISIKSFKYGRADTMENHLLKLKALILKSATSDRGQTHTEEHAHEKAVVKALQSLLKIAEQSSTHHDQSRGADFNNSNGLPNNASEDAALQSPLRPSARSFSSRRAHAKNTNVMPKKSIHGENCDADPFSTRKSVFCDSEMELSDNENDDNYITADEGYEADGELPELSESEIELDKAEFWTSFQPSSHYRTRLLHDGLCHLVVEILIELSEKCILNPVSWSECLVQLANHLFVIRAHIGDSLFLLRGFAPVLKCGDPRLRELQQALLELIVDIDTPEVLCTYFNILSAKNPPVDLLIKHLNHNCGSKLKRPQPMVELEFPIMMDGKCTSTTDQRLTMEIDRIRNQHIAAQATTPLSRTPCIIPVTHARLWGNDGFTLSFWLQMKGKPYSKSSSLLVEDEIHSSHEYYLRTHIVSIGTNQVMISAYVDSNMKLVFETCNPGAEIQIKSPVGTQLPSQPASEISEKKNETSSKDESNRNINYSGSCKSKPATSKTTPEEASNSSTLRVALKQTKLVILNSFNNMHLFKYHNNHQSYENSTIDLKSFRFTKNRWRHVAFGVCTHQDYIELIVYIDGVEQDIVNLHFRNIKNFLRNHSFQVICLGDSLSNLGDNNEPQRSPVDGYPMPFSISNLLLFNCKFPAWETIANLTAMGPDFSELAPLQVNSWQPNYGFVNLSKLRKANFGNIAESMKLLYESRLLAYTAESPDIVMGYNNELNTKEGNVLSAGRVYGLILYGELIQNHLHSIQTATLLCGGLSAHMYLVARIVELSSNSMSQHMALEFFLNVALSDSQLYAEFLRINCMNLLGYVIKTDRCTKDVNLLRSILNNACSQPIIIKKGETIEVCENTNAIIVYPQLIISILHRYSDWHRSGVEHSEVLDMLFQCILALTREKHPHRDLNLYQLQTAGLLKELLNLCKVYIIESPNPVYISKSAAESFVSILSVFAGSPPSTSLMDEIMKLALLFQKPSECYITHDRSKFYFLLTPQPPVKERSSASYNFSRVATQFRRKSKRERPGVAKPVTADKADLSAKQTEKIKRLRRLHIASSSSPFKRNLLELEDNLENVADCTRLNKKALHLLSPVNIENWRTRFKHYPDWHMATSSMKKVHPSNKAEKYFSVSSCSPNKITRRRLQHAHFNKTPSTETPKVRKRESQSHKTSAPSIACSSLDRETLGRHHLGQSPVSTSAQQRRSRLLVKTDFYNWPGIIALQEGLLTLLKDFLCLLPDNAVEEVLKHYVKIDIILVLCNNGSCAVRTAIIKLLTVLMKRLQQSDILVHVKSLYPQHLANQMSIYPTDMQMFEACLEWVTGIYNSARTGLSCDTTLHIVDRFGINTLLSIVINMPNNQIGHKVKAFKILNKICFTEGEQQQLLIEAGLLLCCIKSLFNLYLTSSIVDVLVEESILELLTKIGENSLKSVGHIKVVWDIINMLTFLHEGASVSVIKNLRSAQARLLFKWISMFFDSVNEPKIFKVIALPNSTLSPTETKERLRLLIDRCAQFYAVCDVNYTPSASEVELFQLIVTYSISTSQRCNNFIAWGLQPSRPRELRAFIVDALWSSCQADCLPSVIYDGKIIKSFLWLCLLEDLEKPLKNLKRLCKILGINEHDSTWNLENELERIELHRSSVAAEQKTKLEETAYRLEPLAMSCIESSMLTTRRVAELQNSERKLLMYQLKDYDDATIYTKWLGVVRRMTHDGAPWYSRERAENSWELDDTEGPSRVHSRLRPCHLDIDKRFFMEDYYTSELRNNDTVLNSSASTIVEYMRPLEYLLSSYDQQLNISLNSQILYNFPAKFLPVDGEIDGEIIITDHKLYFMATYRCKYFYINCDIWSISEIWLKRYQHQEKAFEIFLDTNQSLFFSLQNQEDYKIMYDVFSDKIVTHPDQAKILVITQQWREGLLTNWEYLMTLNQVAGRTYNDLMQYPIFPWILSNYVSDVLDLTDVSNFRKLDKPVAVQYEENEQHYISNYTYINNTMTNMGSMTLKPYHYSSHYSNSGTVLHFLVRVPPFTSYFLRYQDNNFDLPDRTFHSLNTTWNLASRDSPTDVKELIPEFFCLPEMFENFERFNFGCRQNGERVEDVQLPPWCLRDARLFVLIHRQALEAELARNQLHHWVDLIFGYKQSGENAVEAINVFHPATYPSFLESITSDPIERKAVETMIKTYGQMPRQLFKNPHRQTKSLNYCLGTKEVLPTVRGLRWGVYLGSPQLHTPTLGNIYKIPGAEYLISFNNTNVVYGFPTKSCIMQGAEVDTFNVISWDYEDHIVRIQPLNKLNTKPKNILRSNIIDGITACGADPNSNQLWFGHKSGRISIYKCNSVDISNRPVKSRQNYIRGLRRSYNSAFRKLTTKSYAEEGDTSNVTPLLNSSMGSSSDTAQRDSADLIWNGPTILLRHTDEVTSIRLSVEFKIGVSAGRDGIAVIWDLNNWNYIRTIDRPAEIHHSPITVVTISPTLGDIVTVHTTPQQLAPKSTPERQTTNNSNSSANSSQQQKSDESTSSPSMPDECFEVTEESLDDFVNVSINPNGKSILRLHTINARYVQHIVHEDRILAATYSYIKEGVGVNVIATAVEGGTIRLWSSWNLSFVSEIITGISNIKSIVYSTHQHLVALTKDSHIQVWETEGLYGNSPKFPQIAYK